MSSKEKTLEEKLIDLIVDRMDSGEKLPTEKEMISEFNVSRSSLRETLSIFESSGIIRSYQGRGRFVHVPNIGVQIIDTWSIMLKAKPRMLLELMEIRSILEINSLPQAIQRTNMDQILEMNKQVTSMKAKAEISEDFVHEDREFHRILFGSTGNILLEQLLTAFWDLYEMAKIHPPPTNLMEVAIQHEKILNAFAKQDLPAVTELMNKQFVEARFKIVSALMESEED